MNASVNPEFGTQLSASAAADKPASDSAAKEEVRRLLRGLGTAQRYQTGSPIFSVGDNANALYRVESGAVALWRRLPNGKRHIVDFRLPGEYFGVVHRPTHTISAEASADSEVTAYRRGYVDEICDAVPSFYRSIGSLVAEAKAARDDLLADEMRTAKERIAAFLLSTSQRASQAGGSSLPLSGRYIGERIYEPWELVSNCLEDLGVAGAVVRTGDDQLVIVNQTLLQSLA
jgi:CRP-like cAMP-binding protein